MKFAALDCRLPSILYTNNIHKLNVQHFRFLRSLAFKSRPIQIQKKIFVRVILERNRRN